MKKVFSYFYLLSLKSFSFSALERLSYPDWAILSRMASISSCEGLAVDEEPLELLVEEKEPVLALVFLV